MISSQLVPVEYLEEFKEWARTDPDVPDGRTHAAHFMLTRGLPPPVPAPPVQKVPYWKTPAGRAAAFRYRQAKK